MDYSSIIQSRQQPELGGTTLVFLQRANMHAHTYAADLCVPPSPTVLLYSTSSLRSVASQLFLASSVSFFFFYMQTNSHLRWARGSLFHYHPPARQTSLSQLSVLGHPSMPANARNKFFPPLPPSLAFCTAANKYV